MKRVKVVAALIASQSGEEPSFLVQQRPANKSRGNLWEFPGGKVEAGESDAAALKRECHEELAVELNVGAQLWSTVHEYADLTVELVLYSGTIVAGDPKPLGAQALRFCTPAQMMTLPFCEADLPLLEALSAGRVAWQ